MTTIASPDFSILFASAFVGFILGSFFFGGLWWTVRKCLNSTSPALWLISSLIVRTSVAVGGFYLIATTPVFYANAANANWQPIVLSLIGFVLARLLITRLTTKKESSKKLKKMEAQDAS